MTNRTILIRLKILKRVLVYSAIAFFLVYFSGCSTSKNYKTLSFFFDGVPQPASETSALAIDTLNHAVTAALAQDLVLVAAPKIQPHPPYHDRQCGSCHDQSTMGKLLKPLPELCYQCHEDFGTKYKVLHGLVGGGQCNMCHSPHMSANQHLLTRTEQALCLYCHDPKDISNAGTHPETKDSDCIACHNPHGGNDTNLLR
ncbi:MAG: cytochrome c3 family protein [Bacteroidales bacterium]